MDRSTSLIASLAFLVGSTAATAAPIDVQASLTIDVQGLGGVTIVDTGQVDVTGGIWQIPAGLISQAGPIVVPVSASTAVSSLGASGISNLAGTFAPGGVTAQAPSEVCAGISPGEACVAGGGVGGVVGLVGQFNVNVVPMIVVIPISLTDLRLGQGGSTNSPFTINAAPWTTATGFVSTGAGTVTASGSVGPGILTLISPVFMSACGNLIPVIGTLTLTEIVPEPGALALIGAGLLALGLAVRARR